MGPNCEDFKTFQILKILILRIILRKLQNSKKNSKNKTILRIRMLVNTGPGKEYWNKFVISVTNFTQERVYLIYH